MRLFLKVSGFFVLMLLASSGALSAQTLSDSSGYRTLDAETFAQILASDSSLVLLDVRTPEEYAEGHLHDARLVNFQDEDFADRIDTLDRQKTYLIYCRSGKRSAGAAALMQEKGFTRLAHLEGGITAWPGKIEKEE